MNKKHLPTAFLPFVKHILSDYKFVTCIYFLLAIVAGFIGPFNKILIRWIVDILPQTTCEDVSPLILPACLIILNYLLFDNVTWRCIGYIRYKYQGVVKNKIIEETLERILSYSHHFFQNTFSTRTTKQILTLAENIETILYRYSHNVIIAVSMLFISLIAVFKVNVIFGFIIMGWLICFTVFSLFMARYMTKFVDAYAKSESLIAGEIGDVISNQSSIRFFAHQKYEKHKIRGVLNKLLQAFQRNEKYHLILFGMQGIMIATMIGLNTYFLVYCYQQNLVSHGDFALILGLSIDLGRVVWQAMFQLNILHYEYSRCKQILRELIQPLEIQDAPQSTILSCKEGSIVFKNVHFHYKGTYPLFEKLSIHINPGEKVGLVGYSGGGKSTFINLILRLYDVTGGAILIDGQDVRQVTQESLHNNITLIPQNPSLFHRSLMENIRYGRLQASDEEVIQASIQAHAHDFIVKLPKQYNTLVGERGTKLSGGQCQRIVIARANLKQGRILILDEATSQLDSVTENFIQESFAMLMKGKTTLVIAHRLSTLLNMDRILVFDKGKIVEDGNHEALLAKNGLYKKLWDAQLGGFLGANVSED